MSAKADHHFHTGFSVHFPLVGEEALPEVFDAFDTLEVQAALSSHSARRGALRENSFDEFERGEGLQFPICSCDFDGIFFFDLPV